MGILTKSHLPLVSTTKFNVLNASAIQAGSGAYGTATTAGANDWVLGSAMPKGRALLVTVPVAAIGSSPTKLKVSLHGGGTNDSGNAGAEIASTVTEFTPVADTVFEAEIDLSAVSDLTKYYSLALTVNGSSSSDTVTAEAVARVLDPTYVP